MPARFLLALVPLAMIAADRPVAPVDGAMVLIRGARVFDGTGAPAMPGDVLVRGDRIVAVGPHLSRPRGARVIDARGLTLLPGLHDLHTHLRAPAYSAPDDLGKAWASHLVNGVTSANDFSVSGEMLPPIRAIAAGGTIATPNLNLAIRLGVPGGHGTEYGWGSFFTLTATTPRAAHVAMKTALSYRPDVIKVFADGWRYGRSPDLASMNVPTLSAIVADAHAAGLPVITHTVTLAGAKVAAAAGVDALGHGIGDAPVDAELIALMRRRQVAYIPTLVVYEPQQERRFTPLEWRAMAAPERAAETARMARPAEPIPDLESKRWAILQDNVRALHAAGIRIGVGTDAGIGGVYHGSGAVRETRWLARLGLTPAQALVAATGGAADILRQPGHGRIAAGQRADLLLVGGRPDVAIDDLHDVRRVFVAGREVPLGALHDRVDGAAMTPMPVHVMTGPIDTGARADGRTDLDTLPVESTEPGTDHSRLDIVRPDVPHDPRLFAVARLGAADRPFAALVLPLTKGAIDVADARGFTGIAFEARGAGRYVVAFDGYGARSAFRAPFDATGERREVRLPFALFASGDPAAPFDPARLRSVSVRLSGEPGGRAWLELAKVRFYR